MTSQQSKSEKESSSAQSEATEQSGETSPRKRSNLVRATAAALTAALFATASYFLFPAASNLPIAASDSRKAQSNDQKSPQSKSKSTSEKRTKKAKVNHKAADASNKERDDTLDGVSSTFVIREDVAFYILRPIVVTLRPQGRARYLRVGLAIETAPDAEAAFFNRELSILDILNGYLRSLPLSVIEDPAAMSRIREQIARRVRFVVEDAPVNAILITDFILS